MSEVSARDFVLAVVISFVTTISALAALDHDGCGERRAPSDVGGAR